jgi:FkbM family methyltransferase
MLDHKSEISATYDLLADEMSKKIFFDILYFRLIDDNISIPTLEQDNQYFEYDIYKPIANEYFVDCGAFNGNTLKTFLRNNNNRFEKYIALEPDATNFFNLMKYVNDLEVADKSKFELLQYAAYDTVGCAQFYSLNGPGSFLADIGQAMVKTISIDTALHGTMATMIKMNIEGSEMRALKGAKQTIQQYNPVLAIAGYHKTWDFWSVPLLIKSFHATYKIYLRSYMNHISFVYYAVPMERTI